MKLTEEIFLNVVNAMQEAEELGGPELPEYIALMEKISRTAGNRAAIARSRLPPREIKSRLDLEG